MKTTGYNEVGIKGVPEQCSWLPGRKWTNSDMVVGTVMMTVVLARFSGSTMQHRVHLGCSFS